MTGQETIYPVKNGSPRSMTRCLAAAMIGLLLATGISRAGETLPRGGQGTRGATRNTTATLHADTTRTARDDFRQRLSRQEREIINRDNPRREAMSGIRAWWEDTRLPLLADTATAEHYIAVKTNLAAWALTAINAAVEVQVGRHLTVDLPVAWCPWDISHDRTARFFLVQPEARYWLDRPGKGHLVGLHLHAGWFNVKWRHDRYQDTSRPLLGAGISYGYALPLGERWGAEFSVGGGYASIKHDTFYNITNGARLDSRSRNY